MGGCLISLCADWETTQRVQQALTDAGATQTWIEAFETEEEH